MRVRLSPLFFAVLLPLSAHACINSYSIELMPDQFDSAQARIQYYQQQLKEFNNKHQQLTTVQLKNDHAVLQILTGQYADAIQALKTIESQHPNLPKTAVNLGTAYELAGDYLKARKWIRIGMQRDANIHQGSEWIHMNILEAKQHHADVNWLNKHPLLDLKFGNHYFPEPNHIQHESIDQIQLEQIREQATLQIQERKQFVFNQDPIFARVYYDLANIEQSLAQGSWLTRMRYDIEANNLVGFAQNLGLQQDQTISKRLRMMDSNKFQRIWMLIQDYFTAVLSKDK